MTPFIAAAVVALSLASPVSAAPKAATSSVAPERQAQQAAAARNYCYVYEITGSILRHRTCKSYAEWMKEGVDPTARQ